ncbi:hypothetical protein Tco_0270469 [Tanacetum coccineum]
MNNDPSIWAADAEREKNTAMSYGISLTRKFTIRLYQIHNTHRSPEIDKVTESNKEVQNIHTDVLRYHPRHFLRDEISIGALSLTATEASLFSQRLGIHGENLFPCYISPTNTLPMTKGTHPSTIEALVEGITRQQLGKEFLRDTIPLGYISFTVARPLEPTD